ncbi:predicted protein [Arabidopsis lyrata subsp. lyrata]|uniref:Predicted protein n=1 Tax=Arabidopsis lyrata subsp. lyrata TaxID=81972 RepID=D7LTL0_ARALL|nr:predicted protein [Arabidopsis lyrata subsp. lyrata]
MSESRPYVEIEPQLAVIEMARCIRDYRGLSSHNHKSSRVCLSRNNQGRTY